MTLFSCSKINSRSWNPYLVLFMILVIISVQTAYADNRNNMTPMISATTDKKVYKQGDAIIVTGHIKSVIKNAPVTMQVLDKNNNLVHIAQIDITNDGNFVYRFKVEGPLWKGYGDYTIRTQYGFVNVGSIVLFSVEQEEVPYSKLFYVHDKTSGQVFAVNYTMTTGNLTDISIDPVNLSLVLHMMPNNNGYITLNIPRQLLDARTEDGNDEGFLVFNDGRETSVSSDSSDKYSRIITIPFEMRDSEIDIIGTQVVPELGPLVSIVFILLMASCLLILKTNSLAWSSNEKKLTG